MTAPATVRHSPPADQRESYELHAKAQQMRVSANKKHKLCGGERRHEIVAINDNRTVAENGTPVQVRQCVCIYVRDVHRMHT